MLSSWKNLTLRTIDKHAPSSRLMIWMLLAATRFRAASTADKEAGAALPRADDRRNGGIPDRKHWIVQFAALPTPAQLLDLDNRGARILSYVPDFGYSISAPEDVKFDDLHGRATATAAAKLSADLSLARWRYRETLCGCGVLFGCRHG